MAKINKDLVTISKRLENGIPKFYKNGVELEKGVILTKDRIEKHRELYEKYCNYFTAYPDLFIDLITPSDSNFRLYEYQRLFLRACMRFRYHYCTAPRAFSKSFVSILALYLKCMFQPRSKIFICAPGKEQSAKIAKEKLTELFDLFPILHGELAVENYGKDYVKLVFRNGSVFDVVGALDTTRGGRRHGGLIDEIRDHDADLLNEVVLPLMNVSRKMVNGKLNPYEPHQSQFFMTSAGTKATFAYEKCLEVFSRSIINPKDYFCWGCDYRVPMMHGLLDKSYVNDIKTSSTFNEESFAREYLGVWTGGSNESWFQYDKLQKYRSLVNPETHEKIGDPQTQFYLLSVDVGRLSCQTVVSVFKVFIRSSGFYMNLVNMYVLGTTPETKHFEQQALDLKKIIAEFNPREVVIDGNGLGVGLLDFMMRPTTDLESGVVYPPIGCLNDDDYIKIQPRDCVKLIYVIKANTSLNSQIHSNCYSQIFSGHVQFLIKEQEAKTKLMATKKGQKMDAMARQKRLMPHEMTTKLFEEMSNLRLKQNSGLTINLEQINTRHMKDKFSSFEYGLWRIKEIEEEYQKKRRKRGKTRQLIFYSGG